MISAAAGVSKKEAVLQIQKQRRPAGSWVALFMTGFDCGQSLSREYIHFKKPIRQGSAEQEATPPPTEQIQLLKSCQMLIVFFFWQCSHCCWHPLLGTTNPSSWAKLLLPECWIVWRQKITPDHKWSTKQRCSETQRPTFPNALPFNLFIPNIPFPPKTNRRQKSVSHTSFSACRTRSLLFSASS